MPCTAESCKDGLTPRCFEECPTWAKRAFAYRLLHLLLPGKISKLLPKGLGEGLIAPGVDLPPGVSFPPGTTFPPGTVFPPGWMPGDPFPPGYVPGPTLPPGTPPGGVAAPDYLGPGAPLYPSPGGAAPGEQITVTIKSGILDGYIRVDADSWSEANLATTGTYKSTNNQYSSQVIAIRPWYEQYRIVRSFFDFDLSDIPETASCVAATVRVHGYDNAEGNVSIQVGTQPDLIQLGDFDSFLPGILGYLAWTISSGPPETSNQFIFAGQGREYVASCFGAKCKFVLRDYDYDATGIDPGDQSTSILNGCYFRDLFGSTKHPEIEITYQI